MAISCRHEHRAGGYLLVLADDLPRRCLTADYIHANFTFSAGGEYLGLFNSAGVKQSAIDPDYPAQDAFNSYGRTAGGDFAFFDLPTPGQPNAGLAYSGRVDAPDLDHQGGFYDAPVTVTLTSKTEGASIRYTTDGTEPTETNGLDYSVPLALEQVDDDAGHVIRARAFLAGRIPSRIKTNTFLIQQKAELADAPALIYSAMWRNNFTIRTACSRFRAVPTLTATGRRRIQRLQLRDLRGLSYERKIHGEYYFPDGAVGFRTDWACASLRATGRARAWHYPARTQSLALQRY